MGWIEAWAIGCRPYALLTALCLLLYLPGIAAIPPLDRDEARFAQASRQMLETGDFVRINVQTTPRNKKPPPAPRGGQPSHLPELDLPRELAPHQVGAW